MKVLHVVEHLWFGGTEKAVEEFCKFSSENFGCSVFSFNEGPRKKVIEDFADVKCGDMSSLRALIQENDFDIIHLHTDRQEIADIQFRKSKVVKTSVFGRPDEDNGDLRDIISCYFFPSKQALFRYRNVLENVGIPSRVIYNPLDVDSFDSEGNFREELGIDDEKFVLGKIGRPDSYKWADMTLESFRRLKDRGEDVSLLLVNPPKEIKKDLGGQEDIYIKEEIPLGEEYKFYNSIDVLAHSSEIGESFGYVIAESMASGTPVVVNSTPMEDNAQIELIDNESNGFVVASVEAFSSAIFDIKESEYLRQKLSSQAKEDVKKYQSSKITPELEKYYSNIVMGKIVSEDLSEWGEEYSSKLNSLYGRLTWQYRLSVCFWFLSQKIPNSYQFFRNINKLCKKFSNSSVV